jgi:cell cycle checkpoint protein
MAEVTFSAISSSVRHLVQILRCIGFSSKTHVQISDTGIRFSVQESKVMQGKLPLSLSLSLSFHFFFLILFYLFFSELN